MIKFRPISHNVKELLPLLQDHLEKDKDIFLTYPFGSFASEKERKLSDVDIAVLQRTEHQKYLFQRIKGESSMIDKNVIARRLAQLEKNIRKLRKLEEEKCP